MTLDLQPMEFSDMVKDDSYYIKLGYEYARRLKGLDIQEDEDRAYIEAARKAIAEADEVIERSKKAKEEDDALKYVTQKQEQISTLQKLDEQIEAMDKESNDATPTTNGVF